MSRSLQSLAFGVCAFAYAIGVLGSVPGRQPGVDSHYHYVLARGILHGDVVPSMAATLPLTIYRELDVDHYWGFHLLVSPFGAFSDPEIGMKMAAAAMFMAMFMALFLFLRARRVPYAYAWAAIPALFQTLDWRYLMLRAGPLLVALVFGFLAVAFFVTDRRRRRWCIFGLSYFAMLCYHGALLLLPIHIAGLASLWVLRRDALAEGQLRDPALTATGLGLGLLLNPYAGALEAVRFAWYHVSQMGTDSLDLYPNVAEFHGFPPAMLTTYPEWALVPVAVVCGVVVLLLRRRRGRPIHLDAAVLAGVAVLGVVLSARLLRATEYGVPLAVAFVAVLLRPGTLRQEAVAAPAAASGRLGPRRPLRHIKDMPRVSGTRSGAESTLGAGAPFLPERPDAEVRERRWVSAVLVAVLALALTTHARKTFAVIASHHTVPTDLYVGARPALEANGEGLVLNVAESDYNFLVWQYEKTRCVQGLSRYFLVQDPDLYLDVRALHDRADVMPEAEVLVIIDRFAARGVRLIAARFMTPTFKFAESHPEVLRAIYRAPSSQATLYGIVHEVAQGGRR